MSVPYREQQRGGLCRLHATNAYLVHSGHKALTDQEWNDYISSFDTYMRNEGYSGDVSCTSWDYFHASQETIISYVLEKVASVFCALIPPSHIGSSSYKKYDMTDETFVFVYNATHIWACVFHGGSWWLVDSVKPLSRISDLDSYVQRLDAQTHGLILPRSKKNVLRDFLEWNENNERNERNEMQYSPDVSCAVLFRMLRFIPPPCDISCSWQNDKVLSYKKWRKEFEKNNNRNHVVYEYQLQDFFLFLKLYREYIISCIL